QTMLLRREKRRHAKEATRLAGHDNGCPTDAGSSRRTIPSPARRRKGLRENGERGGAEALGELDDHDLAAGAGVLAGSAGDRDDLPRGRRVRVLAGDDPAPQDERDRAARLGNLRVGERADDGGMADRLPAGADQLVARDDLVARAVALL